MKLIEKFIFLTIISVLFASFSGYSRAPYKHITIDNELGSYSFEYPSYYEKNIWDNLEFRVPYTHLILEGPVKNAKVEVFNPDTGKIETVVGERGTSSISIYISNYKVEYGESYSASDRIEKVLAGEAKWAHFKLLERSPVIVSSVEGELVEYLVDRLMPIPIEDGKYLEYYCSVYFDHNGFTWEITAHCIKEIKEQVKADFDHIISTFKILE
jgi:hypothetical protein